MARTYVFTQHGGPENQTFLDLPKPDPGPGQLLVAVRAAGVNPADWKQRAGFRRATETLDSPVPLGREISGVVEALGEGVEGYSVGDEVYGTVAGGGGYAEYALLSTDAIARKPASVSFLDAATLGVAGATAFDAIAELDPQPGETLVVIGAGGGVGIAAAQIAIARGAKVIGTASASKAGLVESVGAVHVPYGDGVVDRVRAAAPDGVAAIFDLVGGDALTELAGLVEDKTRIRTAADPTTATELGGGPVTRARNSAVLEAVGRLVEDGTLKPFVTEVFPLDKAGDALALVESGHATGKVVLEVS